MCSFIINIPERLIDIRINQDGHSEGGNPDRNPGFRVKPGMTDDASGLRNEGRRDRRKSTSWPGFSHPARRKDQGDCGRHFANDASGYDSPLYAGDGRSPGRQQPHSFSNLGCARAATTPCGRKTLALSLKRSPLAKPLR